MIGRLLCLAGFHDWQDQPASRFHFGGYWVFVASCRHCHVHRFEEVDR